MIFNPETQRPDQAGNRKSIFHLCSKQKIGISNATA